MASSPAKGVAILAIGKAVYGKWAFNLRTSLRYHNPELPVQLLYDDAGIKHLNAWQREAFDILTPVDASVSYAAGRLEPGRTKAFLYDLFAFKETLYIDADSLVVKPLSFDYQHDFHVLTSDTNYWATMETYRKHFGLNGQNIPATNTTFIFVRKGKEAAKIYKQWQKNIETPIPKEEIPKDGFWLQGIPDEPYLNAALAKLGVDASFSSNPVYSQMAGHPVSGLGEIRNGHYAISFWGHPANVHHSLKKIYDGLMFRYMNELYGVNTFFSAHKLVPDKI